MTIESESAGLRFHTGELAVQRQAGVEAQAARLAPMVGPGRLRDGMAAALSEMTFAALAARDTTGRLWASPLLGPPGFLRAASPTTLQIHASLPDADPLHRLPCGQPVGVVAMNFATRRRVRINGRATAAEAGLAIDIDQAYGNCPQYIQQRRIKVEGPPDDNRVRLYSGNTLRPDDIRLITSADTFFLGTAHATSGNDASHRGGPPGFVRATEGQLWWPDYPGNNMFNSLGNLAADPAAALLFLDFRAGIALQLSGNAAVSWSDTAAAGDAGPTGRRVHFVPQRVISTALPALGEADDIRPA
ncbi:pyridoxamine 5'-phosphate oxidase family protein [Mycobacterium interjectum]|uniref:pyridoxamine 5'-phosphate oxidase family protein n=1 Tax=Mycobacterium interjectum TaxID=33895 RepID=UPI000834F1F0|nr:pyridoxamine 5'-phosphate oxidase family protein [Mycobacterium interjectum]MCV7092655.1 pyridoxamine 5'-phosphate oxidase family protein [Mycobacterium interjectum]